MSDEKDEAPKKGPGRPKKEEPKVEAPKGPRNLTREAIEAKRGKTVAAQMIK